ncbi:MAG: hypothetical protein HY903_21515 [Deltaproteobacteria bacterium]|nr:hypothetical protein [Deltaproteobacteria bacterium]
MNRNTAVEMLVQAVLPLSGPGVDAELRQVAAHLASSPELVRPFAALLDRIEAGGAAADQALRAALAGGQVREARAAIDAVLTAVSKRPTLFEALFGRRLTNGNEPCPFWATYDRPVGAAK